MRIVIIIRSIILIPMVEIGIAIIKPEIIIGKKGMINWKVTQTLAPAGCCFIAYGGEKGKMVIGISAVRRAFWSSASSLPA